MNNITINERIAIYKFAMEILKKDIERYPSFCMGLCSCISKAAFELHYMHSLSAYDIGMEVYYPEVYAQKPDFVTKKTYWFTRDGEGGQIRVKILEKAIAECNLLIEQSV